MTERKDRIDRAAQLQQLMGWDKGQLALAAQQRDELLLEVAHKHARIAELEKLSAELVILLMPALLLATKWRGLDVDLARLHDEFGIERRALVGDEIFDEVEEVALVIEKLSEANGPLGQLLTKAGT